LNSNSPLKHNASKFVYNYKGDLKDKLIQSFSVFSEFKNLPNSSYQNLNNTSKSDPFLDEILDEFEIENLIQHFSKYKVIILCDSNCGKTAIFLLQ
jgi:hypothetical protein